MIETERLILKPLTYNQLIKYINNDNSLEKELNLQNSSRTISSDLKEALENTILPNVANKSKNYLFSTLWTIISKTNNVMVGDICFVGEPNSDGEVEIGYGTHEEYQGKGFMTEAVKGIISWAKKQNDILSIIASTNKSNMASFAVLKKNNFINISESETEFFWKLNLRG